jgi:ABC-2 type transport system ATP-binding protein
VRGLGESHTILLSTHILSEVESTCGRAIVIDRGKLVAEGTIDELRARRAGSGARLRLADPESRAGSVLAAVPGVAKVDMETADGAVTARVAYAAGEDPLERAVAALVAAGIGVREATPIRATLEDVFAELTEHDAPTPEAHA